MCIRDSYEEVKALYLVYAARLDFLYGIYDFADLFNRFNQLNWV